MRSLLRSRSLLFLVVLLLTASSASAGQIFFDRVSFLAAAGSRTVFVEGFESFPYCADCSSGGPSPVVSVTTEAFTVTTTPTSGGSSFFCFGTALGGPHPTEGNTALIAGSNTSSTWVLTFDLDLNAWAVAFDLTDAAENGNVVFSTQWGDSILVAEGGRGEGNELFFGFISDRPITQFQLNNAGFGDGWGVDQVTLVRPHVVPDPGSTGLLFGMGLLGLRACRKRW